MPSVLGIAGAGLIGGSIALRAAELGWRVGVYDVDLEHRRFASERLGAGFVTGAFAELAGRCDVLALCAPLDATLVALHELSLSCPKNLTLVLDVASVKGVVARAGRSIAAFVPTHPIAGSEQSGPRAARADLFAGRVWSVDADATPEARASAARFIEAMGAIAVTLSSGEHDRIVALTSHLPQVVSVALGAHLEPSLRAEPEIASLCGTGIASMLRLGGSSWAVWEAILRANAVPVAQEVRRLAHILTDIAEALEHDAPAVLAERFSEAAAAHARLQQKGLS